MDIYLIRHGQTPGNLRGAYVGRTDEPLADAGRQAAGALRPPRAERIFVSPMLRCRQTAELIYPGRKLIQLSDLRETDFGDFEGKTYQELKDREDYRRWLKDGGAPPGGEDKEAFCLRSRAAFGKAVDQAFGEGVQSAAFFIHGGTIMAILSGFDREGRGFYEWQTPNLGGWQVCAEEESWKTERVLTSQHRLWTEGD